MAESSVARNMARVRYVGSGEAARRLNLSRATILRAVRRGALLPAFRTPGGAYRFGVDDLAAYARRLALPAPAASSATVALAIADAVVAADALRAREEALRRSEARYRTLLDSAPDGIVTVDGAGRIVLVNVQAEALFGYPRQALLGQPVELLLPDSLRSRHLQHRAIYQAAPHTRPMGSGLVLHACRHDGSTFPVEISLSPVPDGGDRLVIAVVRDVSARQVAEEALAWLAAIVAGSSDAIIGLAPDRTITSWNAGAERLYAYTAEEAIGHSVDLLAVPGHPDDVPQIREALLGGEAVVNLDTVRRHRDGRVLAVSISVSPVRDASGAIIGSAGIHRDITARVRMQQAAEELARLRSDFLEAVSHELRTPLTAVIGYAQMLRDLWPTLDQARRERYLDGLVAAANRQRRLVQDLLDASEVESVEFHCERQPFALRPVLERAIAEVQESYHGQRVDLHGPDGVMMEGDAGRTQQILANLIDNAAKYSPEGSPVAVSWGLDGGEAVVRVRDRGPGIPEAERVRLFNRFGRLRGSMMRAGHTGTGLGLYLSRTLARAMDGELDLERSGPRGSTFRLRLPSALSA